MTEERFVVDLIKNDAAEKPAVRQAIPEKHFNWSGATCQKFMRHSQHKMGSISAVGEFFYFLFFKIHFL